MKCEDAQQHLAGLVYDDPDIENEDELQAHIDACDECRQQFEELRSTAAVLQGAFDRLPELELGDERRKDLLGEDKETKRTGMPPKMFRVFLQVAAVMLVVGLLGFWGLTVLNTHHAPADTGMFAMGRRRAEASRKAPAAKPRETIKELETEDLLNDGKVYGAPSETELKKTAAGTNYDHSGKVREEILKDIPGESTPSADAAVEDNAPHVARDNAGNHPDNTWMNRLFVDGHVEGAKPDVQKKWNKYPAGREKEPAELPKPGPRVQDTRRTKLEKLDDPQAGQTAAGERDNDDDYVEASVFHAQRVNPYVMAADDRFSTFALDTDTASYTVMRRYILSGKLPPMDSVRMEEYINAFDYNYSGNSERVFAIHAKAAPSPFGKGLVLLKIGVRGKVVGRDGRKASHLVFAVDTSGSMARKDRMPLVKSGLLALLEQLDERDRVSLITYGREARLVLENAPVKNRDKIKNAINSLQCGESTYLAKGVRLAYEIGKRHFRTGQTNSVILCSDGMANLGPQDAKDILKEVDTFRRQGISFNSVGFGMGNYNDNVLEQMANKGDGSYVYVDTAKEAKRVFTEEMGKRLNIIAKDAKIQVEFNPKRVRRYRLIGYENRDIADRDFRNDSVDAGEVGSGQSATALYEIELQETDRPLQAPDLGTVYVRYQNVETNQVEEISSRLVNSLIMNRSPERCPRFFLAASVAEFAEIMRGSEHAAGSSLADVERVLSQVAKQLPLDRQVQEFQQLVHKAKGLPRAK